MKNHSAHYHDTEAMSDKSTAEKQTSSAFSSASISCKSLLHVPFQAQMNEIDGEGVSENGYSQKL